MRILICIFTSIFCTFDDWVVQIFQQLNHPSCSDLAHNINFAISSWQKYQFPLLLFFITGRRRFGNLLLPRVCSLTSQSIRHPLSVKCAIQLWTFAHFSIWFLSLMLIFFTQAAFDTRFWYKVIKQIAIIWRCTFTFQF